MTVSRNGTVADLDGSGGLQCFAEEVGVSELVVEQGFDVQASFFKGLLGGHVEFGYA